MQHAAHPDVRMITATASTAAGKSIMRAASDTLKRPLSNSEDNVRSSSLTTPTLREAAAAGARRSFSNMGQICIAVNRIIVVESVHDAFIEALAEQTRKMKLGHGDRRMASPVDRSPQRKRAVPNSTPYRGRSRP